ncbi:MAG: DUF502 domain-containing protein [Dongiaceae bacterium]
MATDPASAPTPTPPPPTIQLRPRLMQRLRAYLIAGVLMTAPVGITIYVAWLFLTFIDARVVPLIPQAYNPERYLPFSVPGIGLVVLVVVLTLIGALTAGYVGRLLLQTSERIFASMPVIRSLYSTVKQIVETVLANRTAFREVVLLEYPRRGTWSLGFITGTVQGEAQNVSDEEMVSVVIPTVPLPTAGYLVFLPRSEVVVLDMTVEEGMKMAISGGIVAPPARRSPPPRRDRPVELAAGSGGR